MTDVLIVGAGPAGSSLAIRLARQGRSVLLLDRAGFPREKVCGEGVMPAGVAALEELGIRLNGAPFDGVSYHSGDRAVPGRFENSHGLGIRRWHLDATLFAQASAEPGVRVLTGRAVQQVLYQDDRVVGAISDGENFPAHLTVAADGANSVLRHALGWDAARPSRRFALRQHFAVAREVPRFVHIFLRPHCEVYVTPLPGQEVSVALLAETGSRESLSETIAAIPALGGILKGARAITQVQGAAPLTVRATRRTRAGIVLLGDAAGNCDPITGGGVSQALLSARMFARYVAEEFPPSAECLARFDVERERMLRDYRRLTSVVLALAKHPGLQPVTLAVLDRIPALFTHLLGVAGGRHSLLGSRLTV